MTRDRLRRTAFAVALFYSGLWAMLEGLEVMP